ncbi:oxidoreductase [Algoriphagus sp.]|uniref:oxidoreductase n=1 Tax=Algoriphagus sp. TaxID=1872435 RepID=UPI003289E852
MSKFKLSSMPSQKGKIAVVTGANVGLGYETALGLAKQGAQVILACRDFDKAEKARQKIVKIVPQANLEIILIDLKNLDTVHGFAEEFLVKYEQLDFLILNAGIMVPPYSKTKDGFESQMQVNYFSHFLLTNLLFPVIKKTKNARIISLSSIAHKNGTINFDDINSEKSYSKWAAYGQSKLACLMFAYELQRRIDQKNLGIMSLAAHPGLSSTNLSQHLPKLGQLVFGPVSSLIGQDAKDGAKPTLMAALDPSLKGGEYIGPTGFMEAKGEPGKVTSSDRSQSISDAQRLWKLSEELTGAEFTV